ncbi:MAG: glycosyltransferase family A protein [Pseudomonadota bacterium]
MSNTRDTTPVNDDPLVSCVCVTREKPAQLRRAITCFDEQDYANRELVVVFEDDDEETADVLASLTASHGSIRIIKVPSEPKLTLGQLRNISIDQSVGEFFCQWDDDDWYHGERISRQVRAAISNARDACLLTNWIIFDEVSRQAYHSNFRLWEGSILCRKSVWSDGLTYPAIPRSEDNVFVDQLVGRVAIFPLVMTGLYIYTAHRNNTWPRAHFEEIFLHSQRLSTDATRLVETILFGEMSHADASAELRKAWFLRGLDYFPR